MPIWLGDDDEMIKVFVISLEKSIPQKIRAEAKLNSQIVSLRLINGVNGKLLDALRYFHLIKNFLKEKQRLLTPSEVGCFLSHLRAYEEISKNCSEGEYGVIIEDDVILNQESFSEINRIVNSSAADLIHFGGMDGLVGRQHLSGKFVYDQTYRLDSEAIKYLCRTVGYAIKKEVAENIFERFQLDAYPVDDYKYLHESSIINRIDFSDLVSHPVSLDKSNIEDERVVNPMPYKSAEKKRWGDVLIEKMFFASRKKSVSIPDNIFKPRPILLEMS